MIQKSGHTPAIARYAKNRNLIKSQTHVDGVLVQHTHRLTNASVELQLPANAI